MWFIQNTKNNQKIVNEKGLFSLKDVFGFQMLLNALNLIYRKFIITEINFIEDIIYNI